MKIERRADDQAGLVANDFLDVPGMLENSEVGMAFANSSATIGHNFTFQGPVNIYQDRPTANPVTTGDANHQNERATEQKAPEQIAPQQNAPKQVSPEQNAPPTSELCNVYVTNPVDIQVYTVPVLAPPGRPTGAAKWWTKCCSGGCCTCMKRTILGLLVVLVMMFIISLREEQRPFVSHSSDRI